MKRIFTVSTFLIASASMAPAMELQKMSADQKISLTEAYLENRFKIVQAYLLSYPDYRDETRIYQSSDQEINKIVSESIDYLKPNEGKAHYKRLWNQYNTACKYNSNSAYSIYDFYEYPHQNIDKAVFTKEFIWHVQLKRLAIMSYRNDLINHDTHQFVPTYKNQRVNQTYVQDILLNRTIYEKSFDSKSDMFKLHEAIKNRVYPYPSEFVSIKSALDYMRTCVCSGETLDPAQLL